MNSQSMPSISYSGILLMNHEFESGYATENAILHMACQFHTGRTDFEMCSHNKVEHIIADQLETLGVYVPFSGTIFDPRNWAHACDRHFRRYFSTQNGAYHHSTGSGCSSIIN